MEIDTIRSIKLEKYVTRDTKNHHVNGSLIVIWRDWDEILKIPPKMVYASSVNPWELKGPHLHTRRDSYFVCIRGKVVFVAKDLNGMYHEIVSSEDEPVLIQVPKNHASAHMNITDQMATILALASPAWRSNDDEMKNVSFDDYDWSKWKRKKLD